MTLMRVALLVIPSVALLEVQPILLKRLSANSRIAQRRSHVAHSSMKLNEGRTHGDSSSAFASLGLSPELASACAQQGYALPTAVQQRAVAPLLAGHDLWAAAPTGSGKTVAYAAPLLQRCLEPHAMAQRAAAGRGTGPTILVLVPTRELALQVGRVFASLAASLPSSLTADGGMAELEPLVLVGGSGRDAQARNLQRSRSAVVVATPGRLLDLLESGNSGHWARVQAVVLDEADRLLSPAFRREVDSCLLIAGYDRAVVLEGHSESSSGFANTNDADAGFDHSGGLGNDRSDISKGDSRDGSTETRESAHQGPQTVLVSATFPAAARARAKALLGPKAVLVDVRPKSSNSRASLLSSSSSGMSDSTSSSGDSSFGGDDDDAGDELSSIDAAPSIDHRAIEVAAPRKLHLLLALLKHEGWPPSPPRTDTDALEPSCDGIGDEGAIAREEKEAEDLRAVQEIESVTSGGSPADATSVGLECDEDSHDRNGNDDNNSSLETMPASDLKSLLRSKGLKTSGSRSKLMKRLADANAGLGGSDSTSLDAPEAASSPSSQMATPLKPKRPQPRQFAWGPLQSQANENGASLEATPAAAVTEDWSRLLVFVASQKEAERIAAALCKANVGGAVALHGGLSQAQRQAALQALDSKEVRVLVATDLASRGLDVPGLPAVVNFDLPRSSATYLHRVGRVGRAGQRGVAVSFVRPSSSSSSSSSLGGSNNSGRAAAPPQQDQPGDVAHLALIERRHSVKLRWQQVAAFMPPPPKAAPAAAMKATRAANPAKDSLPSNTIDRSNFPVGVVEAVSGAAGISTTSTLSSEAAIGSSVASINADIQQLTVPELKAMLRERGLPLGGRKVDLVQRLEMALHSSTTLTGRGSSEVSSFSSSSSLAIGAPGSEEATSTAVGFPKKGIQGLEDELLAGFDPR